MKKILIINNDPDMMELLKDLLHRAGFVTRANSNIEKASDEIKEFKPDLLLLDIDHRAIIEKLNKQAQQNSVPVLLMTDHQQVHLNADENIKDVIQKPFTMDGLLKKIKAIVA